MTSRNIIALRFLKRHTHARILKLCLICILAMGYFCLNSEADAKQERNISNENAASILYIDAPILSKKELKKSCLNIKGVEIQNIQLIDKSELYDILIGKITPCVENENVKKLLAAINDQYAQRGFVTTQAYLPEQNIKKSKKLKIEIVVGKIAQIEYAEDYGDEALAFMENMKRGYNKILNANGLWDGLKTLSWMIDRIDDRFDEFQLITPTRQESYKIQTSLPVKTGEALDLNALQQGIDQINRATSAHAEAKLDPSSDPASSNIVIKNTVNDSFRASIGYEINGSSLSGNGATIPSRIRLDLAKDNFIGVNDLWKASYAGGLDSNEIRTSISLPYQNMTFSSDVAYSESLSQVTTGTDLFIRSVNLNNSLSYMIRRTGEIQTNLDTSISWRNNERYLNGLALTPQTISQIRIGGNEIKNIENTIFNYGAGINQGLKILGSTQDLQQISYATPRAQFLKYDFMSRISRKFDQIGSLKIDVSGQWTRTPLYSDDQLTLGSASTIRGFTNIATRVDRGFLTRLEFAPLIPLVRLVEDQKDTFVFLNDVLPGFQAYGFSDFGYGQDIANKFDIQRSSVGAGLRFSYGRTNLDFSIGEPIYKHGGIKSFNWQSPEAYLTLSMKIF